MEATLIKEGYANAYKKAPTGDVDMTTTSTKAASIIRLALEDGPLIQTRGIDSATVLWDTLKALYEPQGFS